MSLEQPERGIHTTWNWAAGDGGWRHADTLPMFRAMDAALAREVANRG